VMEANEDEFRAFSASSVDRFFSRLKNRSHLAALNDLPERAHVLEVGPGDGEFLRGLLGRGYRVRGLDTSRGICSALGEELQVPMHCGVLGDLVAVEGEFDALAAHHVIEHVPDPLGFLESAHRVLKKDGRLLLSCPNFESWATKLRGWGGYQRYHASYFTRTCLGSLVRQAGFEVIRIWTRDPPGAAMDNFFRTLFTSTNPFARDRRSRDEGGPSGGSRWTLGQVTKLATAWLGWPVLKLLGVAGHGDEIVLLGRAVTKPISSQEMGRWPERGA